MWANKQNRVLNKNKKNNLTNQNINKIFLPMKTNMENALRRRVRIGSQMIFEFYKIHFLNYCMYLEYIFICSIWYDECGICFVRISLGWVESMSCIQPHKIHYRWLLILQTLSLSIHPFYSSVLINEQIQLYWAERYFGPDVFTQLLLY